MNKLTSNLLLSLTATFFGVAHAGDAPICTGDICTTTHNAVYISTSGIPHGDIGDYTKSPYFKPGMPTGINDSWRNALHTVIGKIAEETPTAVMHTGDMVQGQWGKDYNGAGVFGPVDTFDHQTAAIQATANLLYPQMKAFWSAHGLSPYFGMGDHEFGDLGATQIKLTDFKYQALGVWRSSWAQNFTNNGKRYNLHPPGEHRWTAYATKLPGDAALITLNPIWKRLDGIHAAVSNAQLRWIRDIVPVLRKQGARWIFVQCEIPAIGPNRERKTSKLILDNGQTVLDLLFELNVDLFLTAEFHSMTTYTYHGKRPMHIAHGGRLIDGHANWLRIETYNDRIELTLNALEGKTFNKNGQDSIWSANGNNAPSTISLCKTPGVVGRATLYIDGTIMDQTGFLADGMVFMPKGLVPGNCKYPLDP